MKEKRYLLNVATYMKFKGDIEPIASFNGANVKNKELFFKTSQSANVEQDDTWNFDYLVPEHINEYDPVEFICDLHNWVGDEPQYFFGYSISKRLKEIVEGYNLYPNKFYPAKVLFHEEYLEYYVWQFFLDGFDKFVDFGHSTFCEWDEMVKIGSEILKFNNEKELRKTKLAKEWWDWGFDRAVMKPEFKDNDCFSLPYPYGMLISERLKNALESVTPPLTGFKITPFPVEFEYL